MNTDNYILQRDYLIQNFAKELQVRKDEYLNGQLQIVSAGLVNYIPEIPVNTHEELFKQILLHKKLSILEQSDYGVLDYVQTEGLTYEMITLLRNKPCVICTFHTGSYRILNLFLCQQKIPYALVLGNEVMEKQGHLFASLFQNLPGQSSTDRLNLINAESANSGMQMLKALKSGRSLLVYIDGNTGSGLNTSNNENSCLVNFLNQKLYARQGIAFLAHLAKVPLLTVASYRKTPENICLKFFDPVFPDLKQSRAHFASATTQLIYDQIAPLIKQYPEQWEAWLYIHKVARIINTPANEDEIVQNESSFQKIYFDSFRFGIFKVYAKPFLLKKHEYSFYEISTQLYNKLNRCTDFPIEKKCFDGEQLQQLMQEGVLRNA